MRSALLSLAMLLLSGCPDAATPPIAVTTGTGPEAVGSYEVHVVKVGTAAQTARSVQVALAGWIREHRGLKVVSVVPVDDGVSNGSGWGTTSLVIVAYEPGDGKEVR